MKNSNGTIIGIIIAVLVVVCCVCGLLITAVTGGLAYLTRANIAPEIPWEPTRIASPTPPVVIIDEPVADNAEINLQTLMDTEVQQSDPRLLAFQYGKASDTAETLTAPAPDYNVGDRKEFWSFNNDTNTPYKVQAKLGCERDNLYFWIGENVNYDQGDLAKLCDAFENKIYPTNVEFFGSEWKPGVDNDPHVYVLFAKGMGSVGGYFSSNDEYLPQVHEYSNAHEIIFISADYNSLRDEYTYGVLAHELQHMIHFYQDGNEDGWVNEGMSELSSQLNDYDAGGMDATFLRNPDWQLNSWATESTLTYANYGASYLFFSYFLDRFGETATKQLIDSTSNGFDGLDQLFKELSIKDESTGKIYTSEDFFADWTISNFINDQSLDNGKYSYTSYKNVGQALIEDQVNSCKNEEVVSTVYQFGTDYIQVKCKQDYTFKFSGSSMVELLPESAHSGEYAFWSNRGDDSNMTLTKEFDLTNVEGPIEMEYWTWYDIEEDYDFLYVEASEDGEHWTILKTQLGTDKNISGNNYGIGYNAQSEGWKLDKVDLSNFAGKKISVRFNYVTDPAVNGEGFLLDDVRLANLNYECGFETDTCGWEANGFAKVSKYLPQTYNVNVIKTLANGTNEVDLYKVVGNDPLEVRIDGQQYDSVTFTVSGTTRITRTKATYSYEIQ